jgi:hypothetical protein
MKSVRSVLVRLHVLLLTVLVAALVSPGTAAADPVQRTTFTAAPFVTVNPCNENELLEITSEVTIIEKDTLKRDSEHFLRQFLVRSTVVNLTSGDVYQSSSHSTNIFHWPNELGEPPLIYIFRSNSTYVQPGSGVQILFRETIRTVINPDGTTVIDFSDRTVTCR